MANPALQDEVQQQLQAYGFISPHQEERILEKSLGETSKRGISKVREGENPYEELRNLLLDDTHQSRRRGHAQRQEPPSKEKERRKSPDESMEEDVARQRRRAQRSPTPTKRKRSPHSPPRRESRKEEKDSNKKKERKRSPSSPSSSPSSSSDENDGYSSRESPRKGHRRSQDKVLAFIQQFDAAFGDEGFAESSKLQHVAMHFQKSARQWWASLRANGEAPRTWKNLRASIMKQFLSSDAKDKVLTEWQSLKLTPYESIHKYVDKFWDLHLKATVYKKIDFEEQKQQFCAGLPEDMNEYVNSQRPKTISADIHHTMVAARINFQQGAKRNLKPMEIKEKHEHKGKNQPQNSSKALDASTPHVLSAIWPLIRRSRKSFSHPQIGYGGACLLPAVVASAPAPLRSLAARPETLASAEITNPPFAETLPETLASAEISKPCLHRVCHFPPVFSLGVSPLSPHPDD
ncbi:hypothetical protein L7F22_042507 [Adiantum nelumboides]|nr:hypothetical protein [Adiantum nelumboides]